MNYFKSMTSNNSIYKGIRPRLIFILQTDRSIRGGWGQNCHIIAGRVKTASKVKLLYKLYFFFHTSIILNELTVFATLLTGFSH